MNIEQKLRAIMKAADWTQAEMAKAAGVGQSTVNRWLAGAEPEGPRRDRINELFANKGQMHPDRLVAAFAKTMAASPGDQEAIVKFIEYSLSAAPAVPHGGEQATQAQQRTEDEESNRDKSHIGPSAGALHAVPLSQSGQGRHVAPFQTEKAAKPSKSGGHKSRSKPT